MSIKYSQNQRRTLAGTVFYFQISYSDMILYVNQKSTLDISHSTDLCTLTLFYVSGKFHLVVCYLRIAVMLVESTLSVLLSYPYQGSNSLMN